MPITIEVVYEDGVLKLPQPLPLKEHEKVKITVHSSVSLARQTAGLIRWTGDEKTLESIAEDPEFSILESP